MRDGLHLSGQGAAGFADEHSVNSGMGSINKLLQTLFQLKVQGCYLDMLQTGQDATSTHKLVTKYPENISEVSYKCVCLNARRKIN